MLLCIRFLQNWMYGVKNCDVLIAIIMMVNSQNHLGLLTQLGTVQLNANLTPAGKQPVRFGIFTHTHGCVYRHTHTHTRHELPVTSYKHYWQEYLSIVLNSSCQSLYTHCQVPVKYFMCLSTLHTSGRIHRIYWLTSLYFDRSIKVAGFLKEFYLLLLFNSSSYWRL